MNTDIDFVSCNHVQVTKHFQSSESAYTDKSALPQFLWEQLEQCCMCESLPLRTEHLTFAFLKQTASVFALNHICSIPTLN